MKQGSLKQQQHVSLLILLVEVFALSLIALWPVASTFESLTDGEFRWGAGELLAGLVLLAVTFIVRRDRRRLLKLIGPGLLLIYAGFIASIGSGALIRGQADLWVGIVTFLALAIVGLVGFWANRSHGPRLWG